MSIRHASRYRTSTRDPQPIGACDRCHFLYALDDLVAQTEWRGDILVPTGMRVCRQRCLDKPDEQNRVIILVPDPEPVIDPRPDDGVTA